MDQALARFVRAWNKSDEEFERADKALDQYLQPDPTKVGVLENSTTGHAPREPFVRDPFVGPSRASDETSGGANVKLGKRKRSDSEEDDNQAPQYQRWNKRAAAKAIAAQINDQLMDAINRSSRDIEKLDFLTPAVAQPTSFFSEVGIQDREIAAQRAVDEHLSASEDRHAYFCDASVLWRAEGATGVGIAWKEDPTIVRSNWVARGFSIDPGLTTIEAEGIAMVKALHIAIERTTDLNRMRLATIIYSDSDSILDMLIKFPHWKRSRTTTAIVHRIVDLANQLEENAVRVSFFWCPGHCRIPGNELADKVASEAAARLPFRTSQETAGQETTRQEKKARCKKSKKEIRRERNARDQARRLQVEMVRRPRAAKIAAQRDIREYFEKARSLPQP
ncbi:MAG: hypothetical protein Q9165_003966 [Trypethelium subeluteriae]